MMCDPKINKKDLWENEEIWTSMYELAYKLLGNSHDAEDAIQDTRMKLHKSERMEFTVGFIRTCVKHCCFALLVKQSRIRKIPPDLVLHLLKETVSPDYISRLVDQDTAAAVFVLFDRLPAHYKDVVISHYIQGMSHAQIARSYGISVGNSKIRVFRGLKALVEFVRQNGVGDPDL